MTERFAVFQDRQRMAQYGKRGGARKAWESGIVYIEGKPVQLGKLAEELGITRRVLARRIERHRNRGEAITMAVLTAPMRRVLR